MGLTVKLSMNYLTISKYLKSFIILDKIIKKFMAFGEYLGNSARTLKFE